jgi:hypothetical protein
MANQIAEECGCYRLINLLVFMQQLTSIYLVKNYPLNGSSKELKNFIYLSTLIFSLIGIIGAFGAFNYNDSLIVLYIIVLISYAIIQSIICNYLVRNYTTISDFHCVLFIVSTLFASLCFTTLTTKHTYGDYMHSEQLWNWSLKHWFFISEEIHFF